MSRWTPSKRRDFLRKLRRLAFEGPYSGTRPDLVGFFGQNRLAIPSNDEYSVPQLRLMIREVEAILGRQISADEWNSL